MSERRLSLGRRGEALAEAHLVHHGYRILARNWRSRLGEIDLVAEQGATLVFVEVKTRSSALRGSAAEAVTSDKQRRLTRLAREYLQHHGQLERAARFDVVAITLADDAEPRVELIRNAFDALA
ncbi:MAG: YraN family protein [Desulfobulbaceae bacterium A2]|nr:MAG: YraN family protein [Desulfobulbaceae bacterium A2]